LKSQLEEFVLFENWTIEKRQFQRKQHCYLEPDQTK